MPSFRKNRSSPEITKQGENIINQAEDSVVPVSVNKYVKEVTIPFTREMSDLLEIIFNHFDGDISRRKLCAKYLLKALKSEMTHLQ